MGKIHTHYDNLKVSRMAPQEVIRAAYKALSQKYHPDKNPGDEKAARIMAILNSAYNTLSDPQRRKEHDEWIASEEWEIAWLESTHHEDGPGRSDKPRHDGPAHAWAGEHEEPRAPRGRKRGWRVWGGLMAAVAVGWVGGIAMVAEPQLLSSMLASAWGGKMPSPPAANGSAQARLARADSRSDMGPENWAVGRPYLPESSPPKPAPVKVMSISQVVLPNVGADCENEAQTLLAPNGEPWPTQSGYVEGFPVAAKGEDLQLTLDNSSNASSVFIKVYDMDRHTNVRYAYVQAHDKLVLDRLLTGRYEIRYQNLDLAANQAGCGQQRKTAAAAPVVTTVSN